VKKFLFLLFFAPALYANTIDTHLRYEAYATGQKYNLQPMVLTTLNPLDWMELDLGGRMSLAAFSFESLDYMAEARVPFLKIFHVDLRLFHTNRLAENYSESTYLIKTGFDWMPFSSAGLFIDFGWLFRLNSLNIITWIPSWRTSGLLDFDIAFRMGLRIAPSDNLRFEASFATFEEMEVYNLHNPFFQLKALCKWQDDIVPFAYFRYKILLGFGRLDNWLAGVGIKIATEKIF
jgi:hypothetical protein